MIILADEAGLKGARSIIPFISLKEGQVEKGGF
jgi:hypothetical protein